ncbi:MAG: histidine kinase [Candidatus Cloacimonetes bacterium]|nr:histidine kinase [Candidatus Cloacimonadota bacterium]
MFATTPVLQSRRGRRYEVTLVLAWWAIYGVFLTGQHLLLSRSMGVPLDIGSAAARALPGAVVWAGITLVAFALARHFPIDEPPHVRHVLVHISASATLALAEVAIAFGIDRVTGWFNSSFSDLFVNGFPPNVLYYWLLAGLGHAIEVYRRYRIREREALMLQKRLAEAELHLLKTQLQPHFLFNTLHAISALMHRDVRAADRMLTRLSELLRVTLEHVGTNEVSLRDELDFLKPYVEIERTRLGERLNVTLDIAPDTLHGNVPHMILQPLVENAVRHAIAPRAAGGHILVSSRRSGDRLELEVVDDGSGKGDGRHGSGVGLSNTRARLETLYGSDFCFEAGPMPEGGFRAAISIPFRAAPVEEPAALRQEAIP